MDIRLKDVDPQLHKRFKLECVEEGVSMQAKIVELMRRYIESKGADNEHRDSKAD